MAVRLANLNYWAFIHTHVINALHTVSAAIIVTNANGNRRGDTMPKRKCRNCGDFFMVPDKTSKRYYCSRYCTREARAKKMEQNKETMNRPLTPYTAEIVRIWYEQGDSVALIAKILNRNKQTILDIIEGRIQ